MDDSLSLQTNGFSHIWPCKEQVVLCICPVYLCLHLLNICTQEVMFLMAFLSSLCQNLEDIEEKRNHFSDLHSPTPALLCLPHRRKVQLFLPPMNLFSGLFLTLEMEKKKRIYFNTILLGWKKCIEVTFCNLSVELLGVESLQGVLIAFSLEFTRQMLRL